jgi:hypothetical protein
MKKQYILYLFLFFTVSVFSQDLVETNTGKKFNCFITKEDSSAIYFKYTRDAIRIDTMIVRSEVYNYRYSVMFDESLPGSKAKTCISIGAGLGSATYAGFDFEYMICNKVSVQVGSGYLGVGGGINYHFFPSVRSSYISFQYWCRGIGNNDDWGYRSTQIGPAIVYRGKKWFTAQLGAGYILDKGPAYKDKEHDVKMAVNAGIGFYLPLK